MNPSTSSILDGLNDAQRRAVTTIDGPLLIVAGPGTGKTLTIIRRIAWLISQGVHPERILAVTFTNRAAREMRERADALLGNAASGIFIGTLHLLGLTILKEFSLTEFILYNREEQAELITTLAKKTGIRARDLLEKISRIKNFVDPLEGECRGLFEDYEAILKTNHAVDFDDLIRTPLAILEQNPSAAVLSRFSHIMVDEYQDINPAQYRLISLLSRKSDSICAIGDSDQAIYGFRGASASGFLSFCSDFKSAKVVALTQNYRSSAVVLSASNSVIRNNQNRIEKNIFPTLREGSSIGVFSLPDERAEGELIVREIEARIGGTSHYQMSRSGQDRDSASESFCFSDVAVIYRTNAQARAIEEAFGTSGIPYQVIGRKNSMQAKVMEDTIAYLQSLVEPDAADLGHSTKDEAKLLTSADLFDPRANTVTLTTMHTAKGLEFRVVFIAGAEDGLIPFTMTARNADLEEERRLFYVAMTRAKEELFLLHVRNRFLYGQRLSPLPSPFLMEIPDTLIERITVPDKVKRTKEQDTQMGLF
ncbi:MAG TPA: ATP-dependent helicase [Nitrospirota bacterium]|nr:ATP-dependent helicase [Nitrospirota bacterium]